MRTLFLVRGYPGLGRVMGSVAFDDVLRSIDTVDHASIYASYLSGYNYLVNAGHKTVTLYPDGYYYRPNAYCNPFGQEGRILVELIESFRPELVVVDGEPFCIDWLVDLLGLPVIVLTHPSDLYNPHSNDMAIDLFRHYYSKASAVIAHGLARLPNGLSVLGSRAQRAIETNTLVRTRLAEVGEERRICGVRKNQVTHVVGVLGGGSENVVASFRTSTRSLAEWLIDTCNSEGISKLTIFCSDHEICQHLDARRNGPTALELIPSQVDNTQVLVEADMIVGRSGRNLVSEMLALGTRSLMVTVAAERYRAGDQYRTGEVATQISPCVRWVTVHDGFERFHSAFAELLGIQPQPPLWIPGNFEVRHLLPDLLRDIT